MSYREYPPEQKPHEVCAVYHWWDEPDDSPPYTNLRVPIIVSIATLRGVSDMPIYVLDMSHPHTYFLENEPKHDWGYFPEKLNFKVIYASCNYERYRDSIPGWKHLSRFQDINWWLPRSGVRSDAYMYVDADIFWMNNPLPFEKIPKKMCIDGWNTGFCYYNPIETMEFWDIFETYVRGAICSPDIRQLMKKYIGYDDWYGVWDEMIITYMSHIHPELFNIITPREHFAMRKHQFAGDLSRIKMLHANGLRVSNPLCKNPDERLDCRGLLGLIIKEFYDNMCKSLSQEDLRQIYTERELEHYLPRQISFVADFDRILAAKIEKGQYHINKALDPMTMII